MSSADPSPAIRLGTAEAPSERIALLNEAWPGLAGAPFGEIWGVLAEIAEADLGAARMVEPHLDALSILSQAPEPRPAVPDGSTWGVFAAEAPGSRLEAHRQEDGSWALTGVKPWCSLAGELSHAIVTAHVKGGRQAFAVALQGPGVTPLEDAWPSRGLSEIPSGPVEFTGAPAEPVGGTDWYLTRPGFAWGGIGVAACWLGGATGLARAAVTAAQTKPEGPDTAVLAALAGRIDVEILTACTLLRAAARVAEGHEPCPDAAEWTYALRVRTAVHRAATTVQALSRELAGPALLTGNAAFAKADADLTVYASQHHGTRDEAALGRTLLSGGPTW
ncbi:acyl-CoA dehydrogenase family protein [Falsarthrobacter nasiphocae]|uniref:Alkylation response protein AidB-like acyl-CoA dehydrogenase n=1 Tax=Falsarthrobacter nasiphocae TaxID=189863 RepID=A0AAE3YEA8_9MICC|nr:acyl-CoA dehydrogenase family protein [Falsarthrobacter nasiphocae]MDR6891809.1 alkylation response protein AidB-like acyl-CoA dehydrogenase [Falsarthrobacter nasiphocae]